MKPPKYEREAMLAVAIHKATEELNAPIDRVEVAAGHVRCWAGSKELTLSYYYDQGGQLDKYGNFTPCVGTGWWRAEVVPDQRSKRSTLIACALAKLRKILTF